jgi:predicted dehydrogenase
METDGDIMIRFGVMGAGKIAHKFCQAVVGIGGNLEAVASRSPEKALLFQTEYHFAKTFGSYPEMLSDPLVDCVYIATPHGLHYEHLLLCLNAGKHVLCEKAFTLNEKQATEVLSLAKKKHLFVMEAMWTRFLPVILDVQKAVLAGEIGEVIGLEASFAFKSDADPCDRLYNPELGGGALLDVGIYPLTMANLILGVPESIEADAHFALTGVDATDRITLHYPHATATLVASIENNMAREAIIIGTKGSVRIPDFWATERATFQNLNHRITRKINRPHPVNGMEYEIREVLRCLEAHLIESPMMSHRMTLEIMRQMDQIRRIWNFRYPQEKE